MGGSAAAGSVVGDRRSSGEYQVRISDNSEVTLAVGGGGLPRSLNSTEERAASPGAGRAGRAGETSVLEQALPLTPRPETEFVSDHKMRIDYSSHH